MIGRLRAQQLQLLAEPGRRVRGLEQPLLGRGVQHRRRGHQIRHHRRVVGQVGARRQGAFPRARQPLLVLAEGPQDAFRERARPVAGGLLQLLEFAPSGTGRDASTDSSRTRVVPVARTSNVPSARSRIVAASAMHPTGVERLDRVVAEARRGPGGRARAVWSGRPCALGATSWPSRIVDDGEPAWFVLGGLQEFAHHGAISLLEDVQRAARVPGTAPSSAERAAAGRWSRRESLMVAGVCASAVLTPWMTGAGRAAGGGRLPADLLACFEERAEGVVRDTGPRGRTWRTGRSGAVGGARPASGRAPIRT